MIQSIYLRFKFNHLIKIIIFGRAVECYWAVYWNNSFLPATPPSTALSSISSHLLSYPRSNQTKSPLSGLLTPTIALKDKKMLLSGTASRCITTFIASITKSPARIRPCTGSRSSLDSPPCISKQIDWTLTGWMPQPGQTMPEYLGPFWSSLLIHATRD